MKKGKNQLEYKHIHNHYEGKPLKTAIHYRNPSSRAH